MSVSRQTRDRKLQREFAPRGSLQGISMRFVSVPRKTFLSRRDPRYISLHRQRHRKLFPHTKAEIKERQRRMTALWKIRQVEVGR